MELSRRELLKILGVTGGAAAVGSAASMGIFSVPDKVFERITTGAHLETTQTSICTFCPAGCGIKVRLIDDIPVRIRGNPAHPVNRGAVCPMAEAAVEELFDPQRIKTPLKRSGRGAGDPWQQASLEESLEMVAERLRNLGERGQAHRVAFLTRDGNQLLSGLIGRFMDGYGSPHHVRICRDDVAALPNFVTMGLETPPTYDLLNADLILNFGSDLLDEPLSPVRFNQVYAALRNREGTPPTRILHFSSYQSRTAANSSEWVPLERGTAAALALGIAHVMLRDGTYDRGFIDDHTFGFREWTDPEGNQHPGMEQIILEQYAPDQVAPVTGVSAERIVEVGRSFASVENALAVPGSQVLFTSNGVYSGWAIQCLNALKGNLGRKGGLLFAKETELPLFGVSPEEREGEDGTGGSRRIKRVGCLDRFIRELEQGMEVDTLILQGVDPVYETALSRQCASALGKIPFIVSFSSFPDGAMRFADLVIPEPVMLERWEGSLSSRVNTFAHFGVQKPVVEPFYETVHPGDFVLSLAKRLGDGVERACPWESYLSVLKSHSGDLFRTGAGTLMSESTDQEWLESLKERGWQAFDYSDEDEFWEMLLENGGWWLPEREFLEVEGLFQTPSGKFEFVSQRLRKLATDSGGGSTSAGMSALREEWKLEGEDDLLLMPHQEPLRITPDAEAFPLGLVIFSQLTNPDGKGRYRRLSSELSGLHSREYWRNWVEINPETARELDIAEDDMVSVISSQGRIVVKARIVPSVRPGTVAMPEGISLSVSPGAREDLRHNPREILEDESDRMVGLSSLISTSVRIEKAGHEAV